MSKKTARGGETSKTSQHGMPVLPNVTDLLDAQNFVPVVIQEHHPSLPPRAAAATHSQQDHTQHQSRRSSGQERPRRDKSPMRDRSPPTRPEEVVVGDDSAEDQHRAAIRAQNDLLQQKDDLIRQLQRQLRRQQRENGNTSARQPRQENVEVRIDSRRPRRDDDQWDLRRNAREQPAAPHSRERRGDGGHSRARDEESSNSSRSRAKKKSEVTFELQDASQEWRESLDRHISRAVVRNLEVAGIAQDPHGAHISPNLGTSPFTREIRSFPLPERFTVPRFVLYDGVSDPAAHLRHFT